MILPERKIRSNSRTLALKKALRAGRRRAAYGVRDHLQAVPALSTAIGRVTGADFRIGLADRRSELSA